MLIAFSRAPERATCRCTRRPSSSLPSTVRPRARSGLASTLSLIQEGRLNAIAITNDIRWRWLPNVPTFAELGHEDFTTKVWFGLMIRAGTKPDVVASLLSAAKAAHIDPNVQTKLQAIGLEVSGETGPEFAADIKRQAARWARLVKASGLKADGG